MFFKEILPHNNVYMYGFVNLTLRGQMFVSSCKHEDLLQSEDLKRSLRNAFLCFRRKSAILPLNNEF